MVPLGYQHWFAGPHFFFIFRFCADLKEPIGVGSFQKVQKNKNVDSLHNETTDRRSSWGFESKAYKPQNQVYANAWKNIRYQVYAIKSTVG